MSTSPQTSTTESSAWTDAVRQRHKALPQRLALSLGSAMVFAPLVGLSVSLGWIAGYFFVITLEHLAFAPLTAGEGRPMGRVRNTLGSVTLALNSLYFGALSAPLWLGGGFMGGICAVLLLTAGTIYGMINARGSYLVLGLTAGIQAAYLLLTPIFMSHAGAPVGYAAVAAMTIVVFAGYCLSTWLKVVAAQRADVAARNEAQRQRADMERLLEGRNAFLATIGHDLRTPLSAILAGADSLERGAGDAAGRGQARLIADASAMMRDLLDDLLDHAKIEAGRMTIENADFDLRDLLLQTVRLWRGSLQAKGLKLRLKGAHATPSLVSGDALRLRQVLNNLISNAVKFTTTGSVTLSIQAWSEDPVGHQILIEVRDTGDGMTDEQLARIFTPFDQTQEGVSARHGGSGLGLTISQHLAMLMGGRLTARSQVGFGSAFTLSFMLDNGKVLPGRLAQTTADNRYVAQSLAVKAVPLPDVVQAAPLSAVDLLASLGGVLEPVAEAPLATIEPMKNEPVATLPTAKPAQARRVLVVDDHEINRRALQLMLEPLGCEAVLAVNGLDALTQCATEAFDLIFMDVRMPELDGRETTRRLRGGDGPNANTPVIAVTADTQPEDVRACLDAGMKHFVGKPITPAQLFEAINSAAAADSGQNQARVA